MEASDWFVVQWGVAKFWSISITPNFEYKANRNVCIFLFVEGKFGIRWGNFLFLDLYIWDNFYLFIIKYGISLKYVVLQI